MNKTAKTNPLERNLKIHIDLEKYKRFDSVARRGLGFRIYERMDELGMTLEDLRVIMGHTSNSQPYRIINGECGFHIEKLYLLAQALDISCDYLLFGYERGGRI